MCSLDKVKATFNSLQVLKNILLREWCQLKWQNAAATAKSLQSCPTLCDPIDSSPPGSTIPGILQARTLEWKSENEVAQSCPTLSDPMACSLPGSSIHGIFQARVLEWGATAFSMWSYICLYICIYISLYPSWLYGNKSIFKVSQNSKV